MTPEDLGRLIVERLNARDIDGLADLYEPDAVLALPDGSVATGHSEIRAFYRGIVGPVFQPGVQQPAIRNGDLAITSSLLPGGGVTVEVARRQADGTWRWVIDQPRLV